MPTQMVMYTEPGVGPTAVLPPVGNMIYSSDATSSPTSHSDCSLYCALVRGERPGEASSAAALARSDASTSLETTDFTVGKVSAKDRDAKIPVPLAALQGRSRNHATG